MVAPKLEEQKKPSLIDIALGQTSAGANPLRPTPHITNTTSIPSPRANGTRNARIVSARRQTKHWHTLGSELQVLLSKSAACCYQRKQYFDNYTF